MGDTMMNQGAICPGQRTLMDNGDKHFLRVAFLCYWMDAEPSYEVFYVTQHPIRLNPASISKFESDILGFMHSNGSDRAMKLTYLSYSGIEMSSDDVANAGWHVIMGAINADDD